MANIGFERLVANAAEVEEKQAGRQIGREVVRWVDSRSIGIRYL